ncbi:MAG: hypothetical protein Q9162_003790 [Coniocarpon cinnabarinum]
MVEVKPKSEPEAHALAENLYAACLAKTSMQSWRQEDLLGLGIAPDINALMPAVAILMRENKFQPLQSEGKAATFTVRGRSAAQKYASIKDQNASLIYRTIENAGKAGVWKQTLKKKHNLHENILEKALKSLISSKHIKQLKTARNTAKKTYILFELEPGTDVTGGAWFSEGEIDYALIEGACQLAVMFIRRHSWMPGPKLPKLPSKEVAAKKRAAESKVGGKRKHDGDDEVDEQGGAKKAKVNGVAPDADGPQASAGAQEYQVDPVEEAKVRELRDCAATDNGRILVPFPAGYADYPTAATVLDHFEETGIIEKDLQVKDVRDILERCVYDGQLERMRLKGKNLIPKRQDDSENEEEAGRESRTAGRTVSKTAGREDGQEDDAEDNVGYRWVRRPDKEWQGVGGDTFSFDLGMQMSKNGFSETPCSRCPVFKLCTEGGPVDAKSCDYLKEWF